MSNDFVLIRHTTVSLLLALALLPLVQLHGSSRRSLPARSPDPPATFAERQADFVAWVDYVAASSSSKQHRSPPSPAAASSSSSSTTASTSAYTTDETTQDATSASAGAVLTVDNSGSSAQYRTVQAAVDAIPNHNSQRVTIQIAAGTYTEKVVVPNTKQYITFLGAGKDATTITWDDTASSSGSTFKSASVAINADNFIAHDISFKNFAPAPPPGAIGRQAVALRISGDKAAFYNCGFYGAQDTLYDNAGRHYFKGCFIQGSIDFIFGDGLSYYEGCELHSIATSSGSVTAQNRQKPGENTGFSFVDCKITGSGMIYLGRAWGPYSRVVFLYSYIDNIIVPAGWNDFGDSSNQKTAFYGEYQCSGPGANTKDRVAWSYQLTSTQAAAFASLSFVDGQLWVQN